jgi:hypothetical protein
MAAFPLKKRYLVLLVTIAASVALYYLSYYLLRTVLYSMYSKILVKIFSGMKYFRDVVGLDIAILAILILFLLIRNKRKENTELYMGFLYSSYYVAVLGAVYIILMIFGVKF